MFLLKIIECGYSLEAPMQNHFLTNESNFHENSSRFQKTETVQIVRQDVG